MRAFARVPPEGRALVRLGLVEEKEGVGSGEALVVGEGGWWGEWEVSEGRGVIGELGAEARRETGCRQSREGMAWGVLPFIGGAWGAPCGVVESAALCGERVGLQPA